MAIQKGEIISAERLMEELQAIMLDPTANTLVACLGYEQDIVGGYDLEKRITKDGN